jgi:hypothetical protein
VLLLVIAAILYRSARHRAQVRLLTLVLVVEGCAITATERAMLTALQLELGIANAEARALEARVRTVMGLT